MSCNLKCVAYRSIRRPCRRPQSSTVAVFTALVGQKRALQGAALGRNAAAIGAARQTTLSPDGAANARHPRRCLSSNSNIASRLSCCCVSPGKKDFQLTVLKGFHSDLWVDLHSKSRKWFVAFLSEGVFDACTDSRGCKLRSSLTANLYLTKGGDQAHLITLIT